jgi:hypothetical protein
MCAKLKYVFMRKKINLETNEHPIFNHFFYIIYKIAHLKQ